MFSFAEPERDRCHSGKPGWIMFALPTLFASLFMKMFSLVDFSHKCIALPFNLLCCKLKPNEKKELGSV